MRRNLNVKLVDAAADLFVGRKRDRDRAVFDLRVLLSVSIIVMISAHARLVIGAEQRRAVGRDDVVADQLFEDRILRDGDDLRRIFRQHDVAALVVLVNDRD